MDQAPKLSLCAILIQHSLQGYKVPWNLQLMEQLSDSIYFSQQFAKFDKQ